MLRACVLGAVIFALCISAPAQRRKKPPDLAVIETKVERSEGRIMADGRVRNTGEKPISALTVVFDFLSPEGEVVNSLKAAIDEDVLLPGQEGGFRAETKEFPRAVRYRIRAFDEHERELRAVNTGPFAIE